MRGVLNSRRTRCAYGGARQPILTGLMSEEGSPHKGDAVWGGFWSVQPTAHSVGNDRLWLVAPIRHDAGLQHADSQSH